MDRATGSTDGFVIVRFTGHEDQTSVQRKTLTPKWDEDFRFDVHDDAALQNEPLLLRVMDSDAFGASNPIGACHVSLTPLLTKDAVMSEQFGQRTFTSGLSGWFPIFDSLEGIRGELYIIVKVQNVADENPYSESSAVVEIYSSSWLDPEVIAVERVMGFVEELVVDEDPEYSWSNNFHSARLTNDARLQVMYKLSMAVRRLVGKKALELGANAVIGYQQHFDIEGNSGMVCRGYGTACIISKTRKKRMRRQRSSIENSKATEYLTVMGSRTLPVFSEGTATSSLHRADETVYGVVPHPFLLDVPKLAPQQHYLNATISSTEATILTMNSFPVNLRLRLGGLVTAKSVKYLGRLNVFKADRETRDQWWAELRAEVKSHAAALLCNYVIGYSETCVIFDDVCVLSATGTAAVLKECKPVWKIERDEIEENNNNIESSEDEQKTTTKQNSQDAVDSISMFGDISQATSAINDSSHQLSSIILTEETTKSVELPTVLNRDGVEPIVNLIDDEQHQITQDERKSSGDQNIHIASISNDADEETTPEMKKTNNQHREKSPRLSVVLLDEEDATLLASRTWSRRKRRKEIRRQRRRVLRATLPCACVHVPFRYNAAPFANMRLVPCGVCKNKWVPEVMLSTTEPPPMLPITGGGTLVEARVCKSRGKADTRENDAGSLGEQLVFLEIELHRQLMLKLKVMGMNAAFSLRSQVQFAHDLVVGVISATAVHTPALPPPALLRIKRNIAVVDTEDKFLMDLQKRIEVLAEENRERLLKIAVVEAEGVRQALKTARIRKSNALDQETAALKWRKIGESVAKVAALVGFERMNTTPTTTTTLAAVVTSSSSSQDKVVSNVVAANESSSAFSLNNQTLIGSGNNKQGSGWFARRRRTQDHAEIESSRWQGRLLRPNLSLGTVRNAIGTTLNTTPPNLTKTSSNSPLIAMNTNKSIEEADEDSIVEITEMLSSSSHAIMSQLPPLQAISDSSSSAIFNTIRQQDDEKLIRPIGIMEEKETPIKKGKRKKRLSQIDLLQHRSQSISSSSTSSSSSSSSSSSESSGEDADSSGSEEKMDEEEAETLLQELRGDKNCFVVEIDDETDEDVMAVLFDRQTPPDVALCTSNTLPQFSRNHQIVDCGTFISAIRSCTLDRGRSTRLNLQVASLFHQTYALLAFKLARSAPCVVGGVRIQFSVPTDDSIVLTLTASISRLKARTSSDDTMIQPVLRDVPLGLPPLLSSVFNAPLESSPGLMPISDQSPTTGIPSRSPTGVGPLFVLKRHFSGVSGILSRGVQMLRTVSRSTSDHILNSQAASGNFSASDRNVGDVTLPVPTIAGLLGISNPTPPTTISNSQQQINLAANNDDAIGEGDHQQQSVSIFSPRRPSLIEPLSNIGVFRPNVVLSALEYVPSARITRYLGRINIHLIKESTVVRESSGLGSFYYPFMLQAHAIARAHVEALGGNALLSFRMIRRDSGGQKNQTYNLLSLSGDAVLVSFLPLRNHSSSHG